MELSEAPAMEQVKRGFKKTEVGVIPEDWNVVPLDQIAFVTSGKRLPLGNYLVENETEHPYIRVTDMRQGTVDMSEIMYVPNDVFPAIQQYRIYKEDLFISVAGTLGIVGKIPSQLDGANLTENANRITRIQCSLDYLLHVLLSPIVQSTIEGLRTVGAQPKLALGRIRKFDIPMPPTEEEQRAIATALSDVDGLLGSLDALIAKKKAIKQGAMQQLLTGKQRLPGFKGEWEVKRLGEVLTLRHGKPQHAVVKPNGKYPVLGTGGIMDWTDEYLCAKPSVMIGRKGTIDVPRYMDTPFWTVDTLFYSDVFDSANAKFLYYRFWLIDWYRYNESSGVPSMIASTVENIEIKVPAKEEQTAIATVLSDMDAEIGALEARRAKTALLKQGMMQELLTGRTRLV